MALFDVGNTLLTLDYPRLAREISLVAGVSLTPQHLAAQGAEAARAMEAASGADRERARVYLQALFRLAGVPAGRMPDVERRLHELHREQHLWSGSDPDIPWALSRLRAAGWRLGVVSNSDGKVESALTAAGLREHFEVVIDSSLVGVEKPDPAIFRAALDRMGVRAAEALYVGDVYEVDVVGARAAGMAVILLDPDGRYAGSDATTARSVVEAIELMLKTEDSGHRTPDFRPRT